MSFNSEYIDNIVVTTEEVVSAVQKLDTGKSSGLDGRGRRGMSARLRLNAPWLESSVRQNCDISHSE